MKNYYIGDREVPIDKSNKIGFGGEADIYPIDNQHALKEIKRPLREKKKAKIEAFLQHYSLVQGRDIEKRLGYPMELAHESHDRSFCGFSMPLFDSVEVMIKLNFSIFSKKYSRENLSDSIAFSIIRKLFSDLAKIHQCRMIVGDLNPKNIIVSEYNEVYWIDVDSFGIPGYPTRVKGMDKYICPFVLKSPKDINGNYSHNEGSDIYALAIVAFHFLIGCHPYETPCKPVLSTPSAMEKNMSYFSFIKGRGRCDQYQAIQQGEYEMATARLRTIKQSAPDVYTKLHNILYLGKRSLKASNHKKKKPYKAPPLKNQSTHYTRTRGSWSYPDPPEFALFLKRYNIILP